MLILHSLIALSAVSVLVCMIFDGTFMVAGSLAVAAVAWVISWLRWLRRNILGVLLLVTACLLEIVDAESTSDGSSYCTNLGWEE